MRASQFLRGYHPRRSRKDLPFPVFTPWRWRTNIKLHYRTLDLEGPYEPDDFFKAEVTAGATYEFVSVNEARRKKYQLRARAKAEAIVSAIEVILSDPNVKAVLFNIFGGITRGDEVARGLIEAFRIVEPKVPFVVRLDGTNDEEGRRLLAEADHLALD